MRTSTDTTPKPTELTLEEKIAQASKSTATHVRLMLASVSWAVASFFLIVREPLIALRSDNTGEWLAGHWTYWTFLIGLCTTAFFLWGIWNQGMKAARSSLQRRRLEIVKMTRDSIEQLLIQKGVIR